MKKLLFFSLIAALAACSNAKTDQQEDQERDSMANIQKSADQRYVDSLMAADSLKEIKDAVKEEGAGQEGAGSGHEGHDHSGHEGHDHSGHDHSH